MKNQEQNQNTGAQSAGETNNQNICIGRLIHEEIKRQGRSVTWFARQIHCERRNAYDIFERTSIDTDQLLKISRVLGVDFFSLYSKSLYTTVNQTFTPPRI